MERITAAKLGSYRSSVHGEDRQVERRELTMPCFIELANKSPSPTVPQEGPSNDKPQIRRVPMSAT
jgi:hypothetical protein